MAKYDSIRELTCPVCGKNFIPAFQHIYKDKHITRRKVCSWGCVRESERQRDAAKKLREGDKK